MIEIDTTPMGVRRRHYDPATPQEVRRYEALSGIVGNTPLQLDGAMQFQVLHLAAVGDDGGADFLDVQPIGSSPTDNGAIDLVAEHHASSGNGGKLWFLRGAGRSGEEIHAGFGSGLQSVTRYRIVMVRTRNEG